QALFQYAVSYDANELKGSFVMRLDHLRSFVFGMVVLLGGAIRESRRYPGRAWRLVLPDAVAGALPGFPREPLVTFDRQLTVPDVLILDLDHALVRHLLERAKHYDFQGMTASIALAERDVIATGMLRWQDDRGRRLRQEFMAIGVKGGAPCANPVDFSDWLLSPAQAGQGAAQRSTNEQCAAEIEASFNQVLEHRSSLDLHPESGEWLSAAWCSSPTFEEKDTQ